MLFESAMQRSAHFESKFFAHQISEIAAKRAAGRLKVTARMIGEMHYPMAVVDQDTGWRNLLQRLAMRCGFAAGASGGQEARAGGG